MTLLERLAVRFGMNDLNEVIRKCKPEDRRSSDDVWCVYSEKGRLMGRFRTKREAEERLRQIEYFKHKKRKGSK